MKNLNQSITTKGHFQKIDILTKEVLKAWKVLEKVKLKLEEKR